MANKIKKPRCAPDSLLYSQYEEIKNVGKSNDIFRHLKTILGQRLVLTQGKLLPGLLWAPRSSVAYNI